ncbi:MAG: hypothetical protein ACLPXM_21475 [Terriglobales bacterium]
MDRYLVWIIAGIGTVALIGTFARMKGGFGPFNLRVLAIVLVATFASLLASREGGSVTAAMGILGAIAGYVFGVKDSSA